MDSIWAFCPNDLMSWCLILCVLIFEGHRLRGGSSLDDLELMVQRKELSGEINLQRYTPEQYKAMGIDGAYYDANGCINFAPPGANS